MKTVAAMYLSDKLRPSRPHETCAGTKQRAHRWKDGSELPKVRQSALLTLREIASSREHSLTRGNFPLI